MELTGTKLYVRRYSHKVKAHFLAEIQLKEVTESWGKFS